MDSIDMMRVFTTVARQGSFTVAAEELDMAVQTVSKYVKALENKLSVQLFNRTTRTVNLNDAGKVYYERCLDLISQFEELENATTFDNATPKGRIRITAPTAFGELHLMPALARFQQQYREISLDVDLSNRKVSIIDDGFDLAVRIGELQDSNLFAKKLLSMRVCVCVAPGYLKRHGVPNTPDDLKLHNCLLDSNFRFFKHWPFHKQGQMTKIEVSGNFIGNSPRALRQMALSGAGIAVCPMYVIQKDVKEGRLVLLFEEMETSTFGVYALYPHRKHLSKRVRVLVDYLADALRDIQ
ncbi:MAG: LysR family transcriptional regulator [Pseudomonadota bacterium]